MKRPALYPIAVPIGNFKDITLRAIETLKEVDIVIGEERSTTEKILKKYEIFDKEIIILNEHNEKDEAKNILHHIIDKKIAAALISEAGTPCVADPGAILVNLCNNYNIQVIPIPGVSCIMTALMTAGILENSFKYIGFLSPKTEIRQKELKELNKENIPVVFLETPYRMRPLLNDIMQFCGKNKQLTFAYKMTQKEEFVLNGSISDIIKKTESLKKGEFVIILFPGKNS